MKVSEKSFCIKVLPKVKIKKILSFYQSSLNKMVSEKYILLSTQHPKKLFI